MAKTNLLNTRTTNFLELIGNGRIYRVPPYQRDYSWEEEHWEDLWNDLVELRRSPEDRHYMGALVVEGRSDREFQIIDGQQRLATLSILTLATIWRLRNIAEGGKESAPNEERAAGLRSRFIGEKDPASLVESSKLFLNSTDDGFYQDYLIQLREPLNPRGLPRSNRLLWDCFKYFCNRISETPILAEDGKSLAELIAETAGRRSEERLITVDDDLNAYTVFETLNARGLELSATDLLKNYLFSRLRVSADLEAFARRWRALITTVQQERFPEFLRFHLLCDEPRVRSQRLFQLVRSRVTKPAAVFLLMDALERRAELFSALSDPTHGYWIETAAARPHVRELEIFRVRQVYPLLFAAWERFNREDFVRVLKVVAVISFRYTVIGGLNPNALEPVYHRAAKAVLDGSATTLPAVFLLLREVYVEDGKFESDFAQYGIATSGIRKKLAKYILSRLEADASNRAVDHDTDPATIEHILPENPTEVWEGGFSHDRWESTIYRIGNLTLLEPSANRRVGNADYTTKLIEYRQSAYAITRDLANLAPADWTAPLLEARQRCLAARAVHVWRSDFA